MRTEKAVKIEIVIIALLTSTLLSCREVIVPKPRGFFRIDLPLKQYLTFNDSVNKKRLPLTFEYPAYGKISFDDNNTSDPGWFNIVFPAYKASIYLTYKNVKGDLASLIEQTYTMNVKNHIAKADAIDENPVEDRGNRVFGTLYDLKGNTATAVQFYVTDSTKHYLRGSLYFAAEPNADSLAPVIDFFRNDIIHLISTLKWKDK
jgi:gliding motility-associated lipoprotein GldD